MLTHAILLGLCAIAQLAQGQACPFDTRPLDSALNQFTASSQQAPTIGATRDHVVVAWASRRQEGSTYGIFARQCDRLGRPIGREVHVNQFMPGSQTQPAAAVGPNGIAWIAWTSEGQDGDAGAVIARRFGISDSGLAALGGEIAVNVSREGHQHDPSAATLGDGTTLIAWASDTASERTVLGRIFGPDGRARTGEIALSSSNEERLPGTSPALAAAGGTFVVAWSGIGDDGAPSGVLARRINALGQLGDVIEFAPPETPAIEPAIDGSSDGAMVVGWMAVHGARGYDAMARRRTSDGALAEPISIASCVDGWKMGVGVAMADDGRFCVTYTTDTGPKPSGEEEAQPPSDVMGQFFDSNGTPVGPASPIHRTQGDRHLSASSPARRSVWGDRDLPIFCWEGDTGRDESGVAVSALVPRDIELADAAQEPGPGVQVSADDVARSALIPPIFDENWKPQPPDDRVRPAGVDFGFQAWGGTGWIPPDHDISVGPNTIVGVVNVQLKIFNKSGQQLFVQDCGPFFSPVGASGSLFDPVAVFDRDSNRHVVAVVEHTGNQTSWINIAVSKVSDPQGGSDWWKYRFNTTTPTGGGRFIDYPNLGVDAEAIYVAADYFSGVGGNRVHIFDKAPMLNGQATTMQIVQTSGGFRSLGTVNHIDDDAPAAYFATSFGVGSGQIAIDAITSPLSSPQRVTTTVGVPPFAAPPGAAQQGSSSRLDTVDQRIKNGVYRNGSLWLTHNVGVDGVCRVRYYEIAMHGWPTSGQTPTLVQTGQIDAGPGVYTFFGDPGVDADNNLVLQFNRSSSTEFVSIQRTLRLATDALGTLRTPVGVQTSTSPDNSGRWGDYSGIDEDPGDAGVFWAHDEYSRNGWNTWIGRIDIQEAVPDIDFVFPSGIPDQIDPDGETIRVEVIATAQGAPEPGSGTLHYKVQGSAVFTAVPMTEISPNVYDAHLPAVPCLDTVEFYFSARSTVGETFSSPPDAPTTTYLAQSVVDAVVALADDFETDLGWFTENLGATAGDWERGVPINDPNWTFDPISDGDGSGKCYVTQNTAGNSDVDGGAVRLTSPRFDMSADGDFVLSYLYYLRTTRSNAEDGLLVEVSNNDLAGPWRTLIDHRSDGGTIWRAQSFTEAQIAAAGAPATDRMRVRFTARDNSPESNIECGVDGFSVTALVCERIGCAADIDGDGDADGDDFFGYLDLFAAGDPDADLDGDGDRDADDFFLYLDLFAAGC
ncbi:MAG: hypothetical protein H6811_08350 [Phycisphaeraceae bacterium]|nr:hypothetical protein [Phycisphaeraceae bacterium]